MKRFLNPRLLCHAKLHAREKQVRAVPVPAVPKQDPVKVRPVSFKLDSKLTKTVKLSSAQISSTRTRL